jgi:hypothetical protein
VQNINYISEKKECIITNLNDLKFISNNIKL